MNKINPSRIVGGYRKGSLSFLRIFATIMIVASHAWSTLPENPDLFNLTASETTFLEIAYNLTKWCVPSFFMVTGALLLRKDKEITIRDCIWKYTKRMLLALVIFGIPYALLMIYFDTKTMVFTVIAFIASWVMSLIKPLKKYVL